MIKIALYQMDIAWMQPETNINKVKDLLSRIDVDLLILPEMFNTGFNINAAESSESMDGETITNVLELSKSSNTGIAFSIAIEEDNRYYNRFFLIEEGAIQATYDKNHLFSYSGEDERFTAGTSPVIIAYRGLKILPQICYDLRFPELVRSIDDIDLIINVASWPQSRIHHWNKLLMARAVENQCYVIGCNRVGSQGKDWVFSGSSMMIDYQGDVMQHASDQEAVLSIAIDQAAMHDFKSKFPFQKDKK